VTVVVSKSSSTPRISESDRHWGGDLLRVVRLDLRAQRADRDGCIVERAAPITSNAAHAPVLPVFYVTAHEYVYRRLFGSPTGGVGAIDGSVSNHAAGGTPGGSKAKEVVVQ
jgi:hypothetical protein